MPDIAFFVHSIQTSSSVRVAEEGGVPPWSEGSHRPDPKSQYVHTGRGENAAIRVCDCKRGSTVISGPFCNPVGPVCDCKLQSRRRV